MEEVAMVDEAVLEGPPEVPEPEPEPEPQPRRLSALQEKMFRYLAYDRPADMQRLNALHYLVRKGAFELDQEFAETKRILDAFNNAKEMEEFCSDGRNRFIDAMRHKDEAQFSEEYRENCECQNCQAELRRRNNAALARRQQRSRGF